MFIYSDKQIEEEQDPTEDVDDELVLIGMEVDEDVNMYSTASLPDSANFPQPRSALAGGSKHLVLMPDSGLSTLYGDTQIEVHHDPGEMATCLLDSNYLPEVVFGRKADPDLQDRVFDYFDLTHVGVGDEAEHTYRNQLREVADLEPAEEEADEVQTLAETYESEYKYSELQDMAKEAGIDDARQSKTDLAEYIATHKDNGD